MVDERLDATAYQNALFIRLSATVYDLSVLVFNQSIQNACLIDINHWQLELTCLNGYALSICICKYDKFNNRIK